MVQGRTVAYPLAADLRSPALSGHLGLVVAGTTNIDYCLHGKKHQSYVCLRNPKVIATIIAVAAVANSASGYAYSLHLLRPLHGYTYSPCH